MIRNEWLFYKFDQTEEKIPVANIIAYLMKGVCILDSFSLSIKRR